MKREVRIIFCGDRHWDDRPAIRQAMSLLHLNLDELLVIEGEADGADSIARDVAREVFDFEVMAFPADWKKHHKAAGPVRNRQMIVEGKPDGVVAFHNNIKESKGTANMLRQASEHGIPTWLSTQGPDALAQFIVQVRRRMKGAQ